MEFLPTYLSTYIIYIIFTFQIIQINLDSSDHSGLLPLVLEFGFSPLTSPLTLSPSPLTSLPHLFLLLPQIFLLSHLSHSSLLSSLT